MRKVTFLLFLGVLGCCMLCGVDQFIHLVTEGFGYHFEYRIQMTHNK